MGRASFTVSARPLTSVPFNCEIAFSALSSPIATKPKPLDRPVSRSVMILADSTSPNCANKSVRSFSVVWKERFPTKIFFDIIFYLLIVGNFEELCGKVDLKRIKLSKQRQD